MAQERLRKFIDDTYGTIAVLGEEAYMGRLGAAIAQDQYFGGGSAMAQELKSENLKAAVHAYNRAKGGTEAGWQERCLIAAAPYLQFPTPEYAEDVLEGMCKAFYGGRDGYAYTESSLVSMSAALGVVLNRMEDHLGAEVFPSAAGFVTSFRASLLKPVEPTPPEEIKDLLHKTKPEYPGISPEAHAEGVRHNRAVFEAFNRGRRAGGSHE